MRILFVHCNYPAQFRHLSRHLAANTDNEVVFLCQNKEWTAVDVSDIELARYRLGRELKSELCHPYLRRYEAAVLHGQAALREALRLRQRGFNPDLIIGHSGFGNTSTSRRFGQTPNSLAISNGFIEATDQTLALATINLQALIPACECTLITARSSWILLSVMPQFVPPAGKPISSQKRCEGTYR